MVHPVGMMAYVRKDDGLVRHTVEQIRGGTVRPHIRRGDEPGALDDIQFRVLLSKFLDCGEMILQSTKEIQMYRKECLGATGADVAVSFSQAWQNHAAFIPQFLCALTDVRFCTRFVADVNKLTIRNRHSLSLGLNPVHGVDVTVDDFVCFHVSFPF